MADFRLPIAGCRVKALRNNTLCVSHMPGPANFNVKQRGLVVKQTWDTNGTNFHEVGEFSPKECKDHKVKDLCTSGPLEAKLGA